MGSKTNSVELEQTFREGRLQALEGLLDETGGRLPKVREKLGSYRSKNPFSVNTKKRNIIKYFNLIPPSDG